MERSHIQKGNGDVALFVFFMSVTAQEEVNNLTQVTVSVVGHSVGSSSSDNLTGEGERTGLGLECIGNVVDPKSV